VSLGRCARRSSARLNGPGPLLRKPEKPAMDESWTYVLVD
jgi:hypothetical protein